MTPHLFKTMYYVYILKSETRETHYIGWTINLVRRLKEHNSGLSSHTKKYLPWKLVYFEGYTDEADAKEREKQLKQFGKAYTQLKIRIERSLQS